MDNRRPGKCKRAFGKMAQRSKDYSVQPFDNLCKFAALEINAGKRVSVGIA